MTTVYILGAGASAFAGFPLGSGLWRFLESDMENADIGTKQAGTESLQVLDKVNKYLRADRAVRGSSDLEMIFTFVDLVAMQGGVIGSLHLTSDQVQVARYGFARLVAWAFQRHAYRMRDHISDSADTGLALGSDYVRRVMDAWADRVKPGDVVITFN